MRGLALALTLTGAAWAEGTPEVLPTREALRGWEAVGRIDIADTGSCTGTLIAPDLVLAAASCVVMPDGTPVDAGSISFRAGLIEGVALAESPVARTIVVEGYRPVDPLPAEMIARDVALLELAQPMPSAVIPAFVVAVPDAGEALSVLWYGDGAVEAPSRLQGCAYAAGSSGVFALDCGAVRLGLGAPIFQPGAYRAQVVGIATAHGAEKGRAVVLSAELPARIEALKAALRRGEATSRAAGTAAVPGVKRIKPGQDNDTGAKFISP